jgi:PAS domain S-box-containing protein
MTVIDTVSAPRLVTDGPHSSDQLAPPVNWNDMGKSEHFVQFYEKDSYLTQSVAAFIGAGLSMNEAGVVIGTDAHRRDVCACLEQQGINSLLAEASGQLILLDAEETLSRFMVNGSPDANRFNQVLGGVVAKSTANGRLLRAFGEMVALLWEAGNAEGAIKLEELWNGLSKDYTFSLFCAYPMGGFCAESHGKSFKHICKAHTRVIPAESYTATGNADDRLRSITDLQQKAAALKSEMAERREVEQLLMRRERELSDFLETASDGIHQVAPDGKILWANKSELNLMGYQREEYIGQDIRKFHADAEVIADILNRLTRGEALHDYEARLRHKDGTIRHVSINSSMYREGEQLFYSRCFSRDITERKRASQLLEDTVAERTAKLRETVAELEAFSYSVSHDLRSPLRTMQGFSKAVIEDYGKLLPEEGIKTLKRIERASYRLDLLVRDILRYSKIAKSEIQLKPINLGQLLRDILEQHSELGAAAGYITVEKPMHTAMGHEAYLSQCLTNLIENALKFIRPDTRPSVRIGSQAANGVIQVWVADNGIGIAAEHHGRIFQIFGRIHPEKLYPGTGIGLAIVSKAVARMGGEAGFESELGKGSRFWFTLREAANHTNGG